MKKSRLIAALLLCASGAFADTIAHWTFNDPDLGAADGVVMPNSSGKTAWATAAYDHSGNGNHLTTWTTNWHNWSAESIKGDFSIVNNNSWPAAFTWSASNTEITGTDAETWSSETWTVEAIFNATGVSGNRTIIGRDGGSVATVVGDTNLAPFYLQTVGDAIKVIAVTASGDKYEVTSPAGAIAINTWYHAAAVCDGSTLSLYLDGKNVGSVVRVNNVTVEGATTADMSASTTTAIAINQNADLSSNWSVSRGYWGGGDTDRFTGYIDEARISDEALTKAEFINRNPGQAIIGTIYNDTELKTLTPTLNWVSPINDPNIVSVVSYSVYVDPNEAGLYSETPSFFAEGLTATSVDFSALSTNISGATALANDTTYLWTVDTTVVFNELNGVSNVQAVVPGNVWYFSTLPSTPVIASAYPADKYGVAEGDELTFTVSAVNPSTETADGLSYQWYKNGSAVSGETEVDFTTTAGSGDHEAEVYCLVTLDANGESLPTRTAYIYMQKVLASYNFDDSTATDVSGNGLDGTLVGAPEFIEETIGNITSTAISFDGASDYIQLPAGFDNLSTGLTISLWAYPIAYTENGRFIELGNGADGDVLVFGKAGTTGNISMSYDADMSSSGSYSFATGRWQHFVAIVQPSGAFTLYRDGIATFTSSIAVPAVVERTMNYIGASYDGSALFNGYMDDIKIYNYAMDYYDMLDAFYIPYKDYVCSEEYQSGYDFNNNCKIDVEDLAVLAGAWLDCGKYPVSSCNE